eukprot:TRINITY_DN1670_c0_g1_i2.p1 TRINITY_DN1670_c0_g1~~TRINITY_DN1670_c0_g1_i2.p1  ORF type:complete len:308 (+),score=43.03 TRINITY_DN1670_c0_g1_i2:202-1125(+)
MWFIFDAVGIALGVLTWGLIAFADWVVYWHVFVAWFMSPKPRFDWLPFTDGGAVLFVLYQTILALAWYSHLTAATTDPGTVTQIQAPAEFESPHFCKECQTEDGDENRRWKPPRAHHCKTCRKCIFRMDHHCPWVNNCVGLTNQKLFILFLCYTALSAVMTLLLLMVSAGFWLWSQKSWMDAAPPSCSALVCSGLVAVECLGAVLFVGDFLQEQIESIQMNSTLVETYQRTHGRRTTFCDHFRGIFGNCVWAWPVPVPTAPTPDYWEPAEDDDADNLGTHVDENEAANNEGLRDRQSSAVRRRNDSL